MKSLCLLSIHKYNVKNIDMIFTKNSYIDVLIIVILFNSKNKNVYDFFFHQFLSMLSCFDLNTHNIINKNNSNSKRSHQKEVETLSWVNIILCVK